MKNANNRAVTKIDEVPWPKRSLHYREVMTANQEAKIKQSKQIYK